MRRAYRVSVQIKLKIRSYAHDFTPSVDRALEGMSRINRNNVDSFDKTLTFGSNFTEPVVKPLAFRSK